MFLLLCLSFQTLPSAVTDRANQVTQVGDRQCIDNECLPCCIGSTCVNNTDVCIWDCCCSLWTGCFWSQRPKTLPRLPQPTTISVDCHWPLTTTWCSWLVICHSLSSQPLQTPPFSPSSCLLPMLEDRMSPGALEAPIPASHNCLLLVNRLAISFYPLYLKLSSSASHLTCAWRGLTFCTLLLFTLWVCLAGAGARVSFTYWHLEKNSITFYMHLLTIYSEVRAAR